MEKRTLMLAVVVALGVFIGVSIVGKQSKDPVLKEILTQQDKILQTQQKLANHLGADSTGQGDSDTSSASLKIQMLEQRLTTLENQWKGYQMAVQQLAAGTGAGNRAQQPQGPPPEDYSKVYDIPLDNSYIFGNKDAKVTVVEFLDFQCPFCGRFQGALLDALKAYPDKVNFVIKNFPLSFHPQARPGAKAALAAGEQGKYYEMADLILKNQSALSDEKYKELAKEAGLDVNKFSKDLTEKDAQWEKIIQGDMDLGTKVEVRGTPTFYINGRKTMARDLETWKKELDEALKAVK